MEHCVLIRELPCFIVYGMVKGRLEFALSNEVFVKYSLEEAGLELLRFFSLQIGADLILNRILELFWLTSLHTLFLLLALLVVLSVPLIVSRHSEAIRPVISLTRQGVE